MRVIAPLLEVLNVLAFARLGRELRLRGNWYGKVCRDPTTISLHTLATLFSNPRYLQPIADLVGGLFML